LGCPLSEPKVNYFDLTIFAQNILRFNVSVYNSELMAMVKRQKQLSRDPRHLLVGHLPVSEVSARAVLHAKEHSLLALITLIVFHNIWMVDLFQNLDLIFEIFDLGGREPRLSDFFDG
jgi:hypothetical protein